RDVVSLVRPLVADSRMPAKALAVSGYIPGMPAGVQAGRSLRWRSPLQRRSRPEQRTRSGLVHRVPRPSSQYDLGAARRIARNGEAYRIQLHNKRYYFEFPNLRSDTRTLAGASLTFGPGGQRNLCMAIAHYLGLVSSAVGL